MLNILLPKINILNCVQSPVRVAGKAVYVIDSERLALTSLPVMSPEVVRCVWDEHRRLRRRCSPPPPPSSTSVQTSTTGPVTTGNRNTEQGTEEYFLPRGERVVRNNHCCPLELNEGLGTTENYGETTDSSVEASQIRQGIH